MNNSQFLCVKNIINKKNKGFTLIEILAAIMLIGVVGIIGVVAISNYIEDSRKNSFVSTAQNYLEATRNLKGSNKLIQEPNNTEAVLVPLNTIELDEDNNFSTPYGRIDDKRSYVIIVNNNNQFAYYITMLDDKGNAVILRESHELKSENIEISQTNNAEIKHHENIKSGTDVIAIKGTEYKVSVNDYKQTKDDGTYVTSTALLDSTDITTAKVEIDYGWTNTAKTIEIIPPADSRNNKYYLSDRNMKPLSTDPGWTDNNTFVRDLGTYYAFVKNSSGEISDGIKVFVDKIERVKPTVALQSEGTISATGFYKSNVNVTITLEDTGGSGLSRRDNKYQYCLSLDNTSPTECSWTEYTSGEPFTISGTNETAYLWIYAVMDNAGNINDDYNSTNTAYIIETYKFDTVKPTLTVSPESGNYKTSTNVTLTVDEIGESDLSNDNKYQYCLSTSSSSPTGCTWTTYTSGSPVTISGTNETKYLWVYSITDTAGNANGNFLDNNTAYVIGTYKFDSTKPTLIANPTTGAYRETVNITITVEDKGGSELSSSNVYKYCLTTTDSATGCTWTNYTSEVVFPISGTNETKYLWVYPIADNSGNLNGTATNQTTPYKLGSYTFDSIKPTIIAEQTGHELGLVITAYDTGSGLASDNTYKYCFTSSSTSSSGCTWKNYTSGVEFYSTAGANKHLWVYPIKDKVGNINGRNTDVTVPYYVGEFNFDSTPPTITVEISKSTSSIKITAADEALGSGLSNENKYQYCATETNTTSGCTWKNYTNGVAFDLSTMKQGYLFVYPIKDRTGNINDGHTNVNTPYLLTTFNFDTIKPTLVSTVTYSGTTSASVKITASDEAEGSGLSSENQYKYYLSTSALSLTGGSWQNYTNGTAFTVSNVGNFYIWVYPVKDNSGNVNDSNVFGEPFVINRASLCSSLTHSFGYTGGAQSLTFGCSGAYKTELWGAAGGNSVAGGGAQGTAGRGGYASGEGYFAKGESVTIYVGGKGTNASTGRNSAGGYNGGGAGSWDGGDDESSGAGGGATDIRFNGTTLYDRIMVAGAGGGGSYTTSGGAGGGVSGTTNHGNSAAGTQTSGNSFGTGQSGSGSGSDSDGVGGGGGGYWGGRTSNSGNAVSGAGGSSYISGHKGCVAVAASGSTTPKSGCANGTTDITCSYHYSGKIFKSTSTSTGNQSMPNTAGTGTMTGNTGNGYAKFTYAHNGVKVTLSFSSDYILGGNAKITISSNYALSSSNKYQYYLSTSSTSLTGGSWKTYTPGTTFIVTGDAKTYYLWTYPVADVNGNVNGDHYSLTKPYMLGSVTFVNNKNYSYSGTSKSLKITKSGYYNVELWGAGGGTSIANGGGQATNGKGGYTSGKIYLEANDLLYIYVGGKGGNAIIGGNAAGGYNGGGIGTHDGGADSDSEASGAGGGATDIRVNGTSLYDRIMVAGGGGGGSWTTAGGNSGGLSGTTNNPSAAAGTQTSGYSFGTGQNGSGTGSSDGVGGAGGGYWGGYTAGGNERGSGAGGSSYISGHTGCVAVAASGSTTPKSGCANGTTDIACSYHYSGKKFTETVMKAGNQSMPATSGSSTMVGNASNGYAKITFIE